MQERFLPIGTVVSLKGGKHPVMINAYCVFATAKKQNIYDYGGCLYPQGIVDSNIVHAFNHAMIDKILYKGYETEESKKLSEVLNQNYNQIVESIKNQKTPSIPQSLHNDNN